MREEARELEALEPETVAGFQSSGPAWNLRDSFWPARQLEAFGRASNGSAPRTASRAAFCSYGCPGLRSTVSSLSDPSPLMMRERVISWGGVSEGTFHASMIRWWTH